MNFLTKNLWWVLPLLLMAIVTPLTPYLDMSMESYFYYSHGLPPHFQQNAFCDVMFNYAVYPAEMVAMAAVILLAFSFFFPALNKWQKPALALIMTMAIGAGLITHAILKDHWGRPRPRQVIQFGGKQAFRPYYHPHFFHQPEPSKSFPCGHCTMGFYFFSIALLCKRLKSTLLYYGFFTFALILGFALGVARMMVGAHFFSDVLLTGIIMWLTAYIFDITLCSKWELSIERSH
jgi:lipid A 4'-phosphatase